MRDTAELSAASGSALKPSQKLRVLMASGPGCWLNLSPDFAAALLAEVAALERRDGGPDRVRAERLLAKADRQLTHALHMLILSAVVAGFGLAMFLGAI